MLMKTINNIFKSLALFAAIMSFAACEPQLLQPEGSRASCWSATGESAAGRSPGTAAKSNPRLLQLEKAHLQQ